MVFRLHSMNAWSLFGYSAEHAIWPKAPSVWAPPYAAQHSAFAQNKLSQTARHTIPSKAHGTQRGRYMNFGVCLFFVLLKLMIWFCRLMCCVRSRLEFIMNTRFVFVYLVLFFVLLRSLFASVIVVANAVRFVARAFGLYTKKQNIWCSSKCDSWADLQYVRNTRMSVFMSTVIWLLNCTLFFLYFGSKLNLKSNESANEDSYQQ